MKKVNILYLDHSNDFSGGQISLIALLSLLDRRKINAVVAIDTEAELMKMELKKITVNYIELPYSKIRYYRFLQFVKFALSLRSIIKKHQIDLIHANTFMTGLIMAVLKRLMKKPFIFRARLAIDHHGHGIIDKIIHNSADLILANSFYVQQTFEQKFGRKNRIVTIYNPLVVTKTELPERSFGKDFTFAVIGRIESIKRHRDVIDAVELLSKKNLRFKVMIIGAPSKLDHGIYYDRVLLAIKEKKLEHYFIWTGFISDPLWQNSRINACISCTIGEALSRTVFECQYFGIPVIASASGGNKELIQDRETGFLFTPANAAELAVKMEYVINNYDTVELLTIRKNARNQTDRLFNEANTVDKEESIYTEVIDRYSK